MIIVRSPLRITLGGGGTDIPAFYREHGGFCVSAAIDKYVYVAIHETFEPEILLKYAKTERVRSVDEIEHPIIREALRLVNIPNPHLEIASFADIPAGTGLGSSSAFTVALLQALYTYRGMAPLSKEALAAQACEIEIDRLQSPIGKQDQYISALGGVQFLTFYPDGTVEAQPTALSTAFLSDLENNLLLFYTDRTHNAVEAIQKQGVDNLTGVLAEGNEARSAIQREDRVAFCESLNRQWDLKLARDPGLDSQIIAWRNRGLDSGARAGKLIGAGGGGFLMFYTWGQKVLRVAMYKAGLPETRFKFDWEGCKVLCTQ